MKCVLKIYNDDKLVNTIEFNETEQVKNELVKILIADKRRGVKTTYKPIPYTNNMRIIEKWAKEQYGLTHNTKYEYMFYDIEY